MNNKEKGISKILHITKNLIRSENKFIGYMLKENNDMIKEQLPILLPKVSKYKLNDIKKCRMLKNVSCDNFYPIPKQLFCNSKTKRKSSFWKKKNISQTFISNKGVILSNSLDNIFGNYRLVNDILFDTHGNKTERDYDEKIIFFNQIKFIERINKNISFIIKNLNNYKENQIKAPPYSLNKLYKIIHNGKEKEISITLSSVLIKFKDKNDSSFKKEFYLPFFLVPLFYYNSEVNIDKLLIILFKFHNDFKDIIFEKNEEFFNFIPKNDNYKTYENKLNKKYHIYKYLWISYEKIFEVKVIMPCIQLVVKTTKTVIHKFIDEKLFTFLYCQDMLNWDFYLINYLFSFKSFRKIIDTISSKVKTNNQILYINKKIKMSENRIKENNLNNKMASFIFTNRENKNYILNFTPMYLIIPYKIKNIKNLNKTINFYFTIGEFLSLIESAKFVDLQEYLQKFIEYNSITGEITFDYKNFNSVKKENLKLININNNINMNINKDNSSSSDNEEEENVENKIMLMKTSITLHSFFNGELIDTSSMNNNIENYMNKNFINYHVKISLLKKINFSKNIDEWGTNLIHLLDKLNNLNHNKLFLRNTSNLKIVRQNNTKRTSITPTHIQNFKNRYSSNLLNFIKIKKVLK